MYFPILNLMLFLISNFKIKWFCNNVLLSKITTIGEATFILVVNAASSRMSKTQKPRTIQMVWQLWIYYFLNKLYVGNLIFNIWCIENPYKWMDMWATPFLKINTNSITFCFPQRTIKYDFFEKYFSFVLKMLSHKYWVVI